MRAPVPPRRLREALPCRQLRDLLVDPGKVLFRLSIVRRKLRQARYDRLALPKKVERFCVVAGISIRGRDPANAKPQIVLPVRIVGVNFRQPVENGEAFLIGFQRAGNVTLCHFDVADLVERHREFALPARVAGVGFRDALSNGEAVLIGFQRGGMIALRNLHVADLGV
jgi:hypothetical protein